MRSRGVVYIGVVVWTSFLLLRGASLIKEIDKNEILYAKGKQSQWLIDKKFLFAKSEDTVEDWTIKCETYHCLRGHHTSGTFAIEGKTGEIKYFCPICYVDFVSRYVSEAVPDKK